MKYVLEIDRNQHSCKMYAFFSLTCNAKAFFQVPKHVELTCKTKQTTTLEATKN
jgi:hypothetical protein